MTDGKLDSDSHFTDAELYNTYYQRGVFYRNSGRYEEAIEQYTKAIEIRADDPLVFFRRGIAFKLLARYNDAVADFNKSIALNPDYNRAYIERGLTFQFLEKFDAAVDDLMIAIQLNPTMEAKDILLEIQKDAAVKLLRKSLESMLHVKKDDKEYWVGRHNELGVILYDPLSQGGLEFTLKARFFISNGKQMRKIDPKDIYQDIRITPNQDVTALNQAVNVYHDFRTERRVTHCYDCKHDLNSVDFDICEKCGWIRCQCNACGCDYHGHTI